MTKWLIESCHIELDLFDSFIMLILGAIIISVPALPGGLGTYEAGITYAFTFLFFVSKDVALTYAIVSHIRIIYLTLSLGSSILLEAV